MFDFVLTASKRPEHIDIWENKTYGNLFSWYETLNFYEKPKELQALLHDSRQGKLIEAAKELEKISIQSYEIRDWDNENISLLSFNFQFNQLLMLINNPMLFPHREYVNMFCRYAKRELPEDDPASKDEGPTA